MTLYITSDTHFYHHNIIRFTERPFRNTNHMNESMIKRWNSRVRESDEVLHLGDFAVSFLRDIKYVRNRLNGRIYLILGNHDKKKKDMEEAGFNVINQPFKYRNMLLSHRPLDNVSNGYINVHGHTHQRLYHGRYINVCVEQTNYTPITFDSVYKRANLMLRWM